MNKGDVALRINTTIYCVDFYFLKQYIVYKSFSATAPFKILFIFRNRNSYFNKFILIFKLIFTWNIKLKLLH